MVVLESFENIPHGSEQFPEGFIEHRGALILNRTDARIIVGLTNDSDIALREEIGQFFQFQGIDDLSLNFELISNADLARFIHKKIREELHDQSGRTQLSEQNAVDKLANNAPIINLVNGIILDAINAEASDIHIERGKNNASVRYRLDGVLMKDRDIPDGLYPSITARIKIMAGLNIMEQRRPQDGRLSVTLSTYSLDMRISSVPTAHGESLVLRILNLNSSPRTLNEIGFSDPQLHLLKNTIHNPQGFILITGPTGSGKTTTLNALLTEINDGSKKIISIEDPVEFNIDGVDQIQTHDEIGLSFSKILRRILRQDPDVIMVGEIRDEETAQLAMRAAMTGHMVLSSLHTNNAIASIQRLVNIGVDTYLIAGMLQTIIAQRLVRKLCVHCRRPVQSSESLSEFHSTWNELCSDADREKITLFESVGCDICRGTGYKGRTVVAEIIDVDPELSLLIEKQADQHTLINYLNSHSFRNIHSDALRQVMRGVSTMSEIRRIRSDALGGNLP